MRCSTLGQDGLPSGTGIPFNAGVESEQDGVITTKVY